MAATEKKSTMEMLKCEYLQNKKSFLDEIKNIFHNYLRTNIW